MELLKQMYRISSPSGKEKKMRKFIKDWVRDNVPDASVSVDKTGNVYVTRGDSETYPCVVAHIDQVQKPHEKDFQVFNLNGNLYGFSGSAMEMRGLGADDKNGIWVALKCLEKYGTMKAAFFVGEEIGCVGSDMADMAFFEDCRWVVQCDRKNGGDLITEASFVDLCSKEFVEALQPERFGYKETKGLMTDVMTLKENGLKVSCVNMSCGYYRPHTEEEFTVFSQLENCLAFVEWIVENVTGVYPHECEDYRYGQYGGYGWYMGSGASTKKKSQFDTYGFGRAWDIDAQTPKEKKEVDDLGMTKQERRDEQESRCYEDVDAYLMNYPDAEPYDIAWDIAWRYPDLDFDEVVGIASDLIGYYR